MVPVGVFGASGYTGHELVRLLVRHPEVRLVFATSREHAGSKLSALYPAGPDVVLTDPDDANVREVQVVFLCLPHGASAGAAAHALDAGACVIDLSADFRLSDPADYRQWYGIEHPHPELLPEAVYGLTEVYRADLASARLVANPGCYPTSVLLALFPLAGMGLLRGTIIIDAKSGVSGAGRAPTPATHFVEVADNLKPYKIGRAHRHLPEMERVLARWGGGAPKLVFAPHLLPVPRGLLSTIYVPLAERVLEPDVRAAYEDAYGGEPFVRLLPPGEAASLAHVLNTNHCAVGLTLAGDVLLITSALDNLIKGAAGQAVQNMNTLLHLDERTGLA